MARDGLPVALSKYNAPLKTYLVLGFKPLIINEILNTLSEWARDLSLIESFSGTR